MRRNSDPYRSFTTTLPVEVLRELDRVAKEREVRKKDIIIEAFTSWNEERKQALLAEKHRKREWH